MGWLARRSKRSDQAAVHGHVAELARWHRAHRDKLEAEGCQIVLTEASRNEEAGAMIIFTAPLRQGHLIAWNSGWIEALVNRPVFGVEIPPLSVTLTQTGGSK